MKGMMEGYTKNLKGPSSSQTTEVEDPPEARELLVVPVEVDESSDDEREEQLRRDEELAREMEEAEQRSLEELEAAKQRELEAAEQRELEATKQRELEAAALEAAKQREREAAEDKVRLIMEIMNEQEKKSEATVGQQKNVQHRPNRREARAKQNDYTTSESEEETSDDDSSDDDIVKWAMKEATAKRKAREANRKIRDQELHTQFSAMNINNIGHGAGPFHPGYPYTNQRSYYGGPVPGMSAGLWTNERSGNVTTTIKHNVGNDNSTHIKKGTISQLFFVLTVLIAPLNLVVKRVK